MVRDFRYYYENTEKIDEEHPKHHFYDGWGRGENVLKAKTLEDARKKAIRLILDEHPGLTDKGMKMGKAKELPRMTLYVFPFKKFPKEKFVVGAIEGIDKVHLDFGNRMADFLTDVPGPISYQ